MTPDQQGRFCTHCQKTVVDFTAMTDEQVLAHLQRTGGPNCGRFRPDQLNRVLVESLNRRVSRWQWASLLLSGWLSSQIVQAQSGNEPNGGAVVQSLDTLLANTTIDSTKQLATVLIKGQVISASEHFPIPGASISILDTEYKAFTNSAGLFLLMIPAPSSDSIIQLSVSYVFYATQRVKLTSVTIGIPVLVELQEDTTTLNEQFIVGYVIQKPTLWRRIRNWIRR
jgi:hypothetical protein